MKNKLPKPVVLRKVSLKLTKVPVQKTGMNAGISGGPYQCC